MSVFVPREFKGESIRVLLRGGRIVTGRLIGFDIFSSLVLDEAMEFIIDPETKNLTGEIQNLGEVVIRGPMVTSLELAKKEKKSRKQGRRY